MVIRMAHTIKQPCSYTIVRSWISFDKIIDLIQETEVFFFSQKKKRKEGSAKERGREMYCRCTELVMMRLLA